MESILNIKQAQEYMGISKSFLYKLTSASRIKFYKPSGKLIYFKKSDLDNWMLQNENSSVEDLEKEVKDYLSRK